MAAVKKEVTYRVFDKENSVGFMHPEAKKFVTIGEDSEFIVPEGDKEAIEILEHAAGTSEV